MSMLINGVYQTHELLGEGGMARVFRATNVESGEEVAIKLLKHTHDAAEQRQRFLQEIIAINKIEHPCVLGVRDFGVIFGTNEMFLAMDLLRGETLREALFRRRIDAHVALNHICEILDALHRYHRAGVVHKDIKPSNFFIEREGDHERMILMDFGISHQLGNTRVTAQNQIMATMQYCAPEYLRYQEVSPALDIYQVGLVLAEMLTGTRAVSSSDPIVCLQQHSTGELELPHVVSSGALGKVLRRSLSLVPADRPDAAELRELLLAIDAAALEQRLVDWESARQVPEADDVDTASFLRQFASGQHGVEVMSSEYDGADEGPVLLEHSEALEVIEAPSEPPMHDSGARDRPGANMLLLWIIAILMILLAMAVVALVFLAHSASS